MSQNTVDVSPEQVQREWSNIRVDIPVEAAAGDYSPRPVGDAVGEIEISSGELLAGPVRLIANYVAPNWDIADSECQMMADAYGAIIDKYFPGLTDSGGPVLAAVMVTFAVAGARMGKPMKIKEPEPGQKGAGVSMDMEVKAEAESEH